MTQETKILIGNWDTTLKEIMQFAAMWMDLESIILNEVSLRGADTELSLLNGI